MSNRELIEKLRRNPRGVMFELEHECADALEKAETALGAIKAAQPDGGMSDKRINELWAWSGEPEAERTASTRQHAFAYALLAASKETR
jgi:hypothetical protein